MISFKFTDQDREILDEARRQAKLATKYARDFESDEDKLLPRQFPEAEGLPNVHAMLDACTDEISGHKIINALIYLEDWYGGVPLREVRYSLAIRCSRSPGTPEQFARWRDNTIAIGLTEPVGGSDPASTKTSPVMIQKPTNGSLTVRRSSHLRAGLRRRSCACAHDPSRSSAAAIDFSRREGTPGFASANRSAKWESAGRIPPGCPFPTAGYRLSIISTAT